MELVNVRIKTSATPIPVQLPELEPSLTAPEAIAQRSVYGVKQPVPVFQRETLLAGQQINGPALIVEQVSTTWLAPYWHCMVDKVGNLKLNRE